MHFCFCNITSKKDNRKKSGKEKKKKTELKINKQAFQGSMKIHQLL